MMQYTIRPIRNDDVSFLWEMLYESLFVPEGQKPFSKDIIKDRTISKYVDGWGQEGDFGFIAINSHNQPIGSITARYFSENNKGFGYIDKDIPELGMAMLSEFRGKGIGTALLNQLLEEARKKEIKGLSLSVDPLNRVAVHLYQQFGFKEVGMVGTSITMVVRL